MRVLVVHPGPQFSVADVFNGYVAGLRANGVTVGELDLAARLNFYASAKMEMPDGEHRKALNDQEAVRLAAKGIQSACYEFWPDVVVIVSGFFVPVELYGLLRHRGQRVVLIHTEEPYETDRQLTRAAYADLNILNDPTNLDAFAEVAPSAYIPHAYDPSLHRPGPASADLRSDFAFCGTGYAARVALFEAVDWANIAVALAGFWQDTAPDSPLRDFVVHDLAECFDNADAVDLYRSTKVSANLYREPRGWAMGPREVEMAAIGLPFLRDPRGEGDEVLPFLPTFDGPDDFADKLRWLLAHDDARADLGRRCREAVADRTFAANAAHLLRLLDQPASAPVTPALSRKAG